MCVCVCVAVAVQRAGRAEELLTRLDDFPFVELITWGLPRRLTGESRPTTRGELPDTERVGAEA